MLASVPRVSSTGSDMVERFWAPRNTGGPEVITQDKTGPSMTAPTAVKVSPISAADATVSHTVNANDACTER